MKNLTYYRTTIDGIPVRLPNLALDKTAQDNPPLGRWGLERQKYLGDRNLYGLYLMRGTLFQHLREVDQAAERMEAQLKASRMEVENPPDPQSQPLQWAQYLENLQASVDEIIRHELIYI